MKIDVKGINESYIEGELVTGFVGVSKSAFDFCRVVSCDISFVYRTVHIVKTGQCYSFIGVKIHGQDETHMECAISNYIHVSKDVKICDIIQYPIDMDSRTMLAFQFEIPNNIRTMKMKMGKSGNYRTATCGVLINLRVKSYRKTKNVTKFVGLRI